MPSQSYFPGFDPPSNQSLWEQAKLQACNNEQILLKKLLQTIRSPFEYLKSNRYFKWVHSLADYETDASKGFSILEQISKKDVAILHLGYRIFQARNYEGKGKTVRYFELSDVMNQLVKLDRKIIGIGLMDENW